MRPYGHDVPPEVDLTGITIKGLCEWDYNVWRCKVLYPNDRFMVFTVCDSPATVLEVSAFSKDLAISEIRGRIASQVIEDNAIALERAETATRRGLSEDIVL